STVALYVFSIRFSLFEFQIPIRYVLILNITAIGVVGLLVARCVRPDARPLSAGALLGFCFALLVTGIIERGRRPSLEFVDVVRFMNAGSKYRARCSPGDDALAYVAETWSPALVCQKAEFSLGYTSLVKVKYWTVPGGRKNICATCVPGLPRIYVGFGF